VGIRKKCPKIGSIRFKGALSRGWRKRRTLAEAAIPETLKSKRRKKPKVAPMKGGTMLAKRDLSRS